MYIFVGSYQNIDKRFAFYKMDEKIATDFHKRKLIEHGSKIGGQVDAFKLSFWTTPAGAVRLKRRVDICREFIGGHGHNLRILEIGCGSGLFSGYLKESLFAAVDISFDLIKEAKQNCAAVSFVVADAELLPFKNGSFDGIIGFSVLEYLDLQMIFSECKRLLRPGGKVLFSEPNLFNPQIAIQKSISRIKFAMKSWHRDRGFIRWLLAHKMKKNGFQIGRAHV